MTVVASNPKTPPLTRPVTALYGVGPERAKQLERLEIVTVEDLLLHRPHRYEDRRNFYPIAKLQPEEAATTRGSIVAMGVKWFKQHTRSIFEIVLDDGTARLHCQWWNQPYREAQFAVGDEVVVFGKLRSLKPRAMDNPETEIIEKGEEAFVHFNRITPVYPLTEGLPQRWLRGLIWRTLGSYEGEITDPWPSEDVERGAKSIEREEGRASGVGTKKEPARVEAVSLALRPSSFALPLSSRARAVHLLHFPEEMADVETARRRLALDEFIALQRQMLQRRRNFESKAQALPCGGDNHLMKPFLARLGFKLTNAQTEVLRQLRKDLTGAYPMRRLLQGDVGSGKTAVAACSALMTLESGYNVALMAPTEILAEQHYATFQRWFEPLGIAVELRTGSHKTGQTLKSKGSSGEEESNTPPAALRAMKATDEATEPSARSTLDARRSAPSPSLIIGTHALVAAGFKAENLGLVIIDEQHKFGVTQREQLVRKGRYPHLLVMTATPIPRTFGLTLYGDLDVSVINELPPGRGRIKTFVRGADKLPQVWAFIRERLAEGRQAYVVYPRVEESGQNGLKAVTREFEQLQQALQPFKVGLLHGRLKSAEKEAVMTAFRANQAQVLLATALIEVGVDVPNATLMLVENAERFGLAQLHQLRGRIGRGAHDSYCILVGTVKTKEAHERLRVLEQTGDGFQIAEADLKLRGPGELLGQQQSGMPRFRFGDLAGDLELIKLARQLVAAW